MRPARALISALFVLSVVFTAGCVPDTDGAPVARDAPENPIPDVNPQGMFRSAPEPNDE